MQTPRVSILTAVYNPPRRVFEDTVRSVLSQTVRDWEWVLTDDCSTAAWVRGRLEELAASDDRIKVRHHAKNVGIVAASNSSLDWARGEFVALLDHDDLLVRHAIASMLGAIDPHEGSDAPVDFGYSDQDLMTASGRAHTPYHKPDWSPERLRHHMYTSHFAMLRRSLVLEVGGFRAGYDGSQDHDLVLRVGERARRVVHVGKVLYHWRQVEGSAAADSNAKPYAWDAGVRAVQDHLDRVGIAATASRGASPGLYRVQRVPDTTTPVSIVIPTIGSSGVVWGARRTFLVDAVRSVIEKTAHTNLEFVVVYDPPTPPAALQELRRLASDAGVGLKLVPFRERFNFSAKCNVGALRAEGEALIFLNDDIEAKSPEVVGSLLAPLDEEGVGATGAKLLFENLTLQHAGVVHGSGTITHAHYGAPPDLLGPYGELVINREVSALTGACLAIRRETFEAVGGFNERLPSNYNDVDFCLKVRSLGLRMVWLHETELYHFESVSRSSTVQSWETRTVTERWGNLRSLRERYSNGVR